MIIPYYYVHKIAKFIVGDYAPWLSDHCPISTFITLNKCLQGENKGEELRDTETSFIFDLNAKSLFLNELKSKHNADNLKKIVENDSLSSLNIGAAIKTLLLESAARCKIKRRKQPKDSDQKTTPWFDGTCERAKNDVRKLEMS